MNSPRSNVKLEGQMNSEFDEIAIHGKLMKRYRRPILSFLSREKSTLEARRDDLGVLRD